MVHYLPEQQAAPALPPICPKCGSHRTEVVGRSHDGRTLTVRCNSCGERSLVTIDHANAAATTDATAEIEAIRAVSIALSKLQDPAACTRVLNWAHERFAAELGASPQPARVATPAVSDQTLAVADLGELFSHPRPAIAAADLAVDHDMFGGPARQPAAAAQDSARTHDVRVHDDGSDFESLVRRFVDDLQRLAREWGTVFSPGRAIA